MKISTNLLTLAAATLVAVSANAQKAQFSSDLRHAATTTRIMQPMKVINAPLTPSVAATGLTANITEAPASRAEAWKAGSTGTYNTILSNFFKNWGTTFKNVKLQTRNTEDANVTEYRIVNPIGFINDDKTPNDELYSPEFSVTVDGDANYIIMPAMATPLSLYNGKVTLMHADEVGWCDYCWENGLIFNNEQEYEQSRNSALGASYFDEVQGRYYFLVRYFLDTNAGEEGGYYLTGGRGYETFQLDGNYPSFDFTMSNPYFFNENGAGYVLLNFTINDNAEARIYAMPSDSTETSEDISNIANSIFKDEGVYNYTQITTDGMHKVEVADGEVQNGKYLIVGVSIDPNGAGKYDYFWADATLDADWTYAGLGLYTDGIVRYALNPINEGFPNGYTAVTAFEKKKDADVYRMMGAYGEMAQYLDNRFTNIYYDANLDVMTIHTEDPAKVYIENGTTGIALTSENEQGAEVKSFINYQCDCFNYLGTPQIDETLFGTNDNGTITFPKADPDSQFAALYVEMDEENYLCNLDGDFKIVLPYAAGVNNVIADTDAPVVYYNMMGQKVSNPVAGGVYVRTQGAKATKIVK